MAHSTLRTPKHNNASMPQPPGPKEATIQQLLRYSKALKVVELPPVGQVQVVLN